MVVDDLLLAKNGRVTRDLALQLLALPVGATLPTIAQWRTRFDVGSGTIQKSFQDLESVHAVRVSSRGHLGSVLLDKSVACLWAVARLPALVTAMPLPHSLEFGTLATVLYAEFERLRIPFDLAFMHGSRVRLQALRDGKVDAVVLSALSAECDPARDPALRLLALPIAYYDDDSVVVLSHTDIDVADPSVRVGIDRRSIDHTFLTERYFPCSAYATYVDCAYTHLPASISTGALDVAMWHTTSAYPHAHIAGLASRTSGERLTSDERARLQRAVLVFRDDSHAAVAIAALDAANLATIAADVRAQRVPVRY